MCVCFFYPQFCVSPEAINYSTLIIFWSENAFWLTSLNPFKSSFFCLSSHDLILPASVHLDYGYFPLFAISQPFHSTSVNHSHAGLRRDSENLNAVKSKGVLLSAIWSSKEEQASSSHYKIKQDKSRFNLSLNPWFHCHFHNYFKVSEWSLGFRGSIWVSCFHQHFNYTTFQMYRICFLCKDKWTSQFFCVIYFKHSSARSAELKSMDWSRQNINSEISLI